MVIIISSAKDGRVEGRKGGIDLALAGSWQLAARHIIHCPPSTISPLPSAV